MNIYCLQVRMHSSDEALGTKTITEPITDYDNNFEIAVDMKNKSATA